MSLNVDDARLSSLSINGWLGLGLCAGGAYAMIHAGVDWAMNGADPVIGLVGGGFLLLIGSALAHDDATPEIATHCENCGTHVRNDSARDSADEHVEVVATGAPRRLTVGPFSMVLQEHRDERIYCSGECASEHDRVVITGSDLATIPSEEVEQHAD